jgi:hypothetical protein
MKRLVALIFAVALFTVQPAAADDLVTVPNLKGMKGGNDIIGILSPLALNAKFADPILAPSRKVDRHSSARGHKGAQGIHGAYHRLFPLRTCSRGAAT